MASYKTFNPELEEMLKEHLPYRLGHLDGLRWASQVVMRRIVNSKICLSLNGVNPICFSKARPLTNPLFETGILYCRVLLNFLGIKHDNGKLIPITQHNDLTIEKFGLQFITIDELISAPTGSPEKIKQGCINTLFSASKAVAHFKNKEARLKSEDSFLCATTTMWLTEEYVYKKLGRPVPSYRIWPDFK